MNTIKKILVTTDSADEVSTASKVGADLAVRLGADLHVLHVAKSLDADYDYAIRDLSEAIQKKLSEDLEKTYESVSVGAKANLYTRVRIGAAANQVLQYVQEQDIDLVLIEARAEGQGTKRLGVLSSAVARAVPFDVFFVHPGNAGPFKNLVVATDYSDCAKDALLRAINYVKLHGEGTVTAVHSYQLPARHYYTGHTPEEISATLKVYAEKHFAEWMQGVDTQGLEIKQEIVEGSPDAAVIDYAKANGADLLVIGSHGRTASSAMMIGSVAQKIVLNAPCNVWVERSDGEAMGIWGAIKRAMGIE